MDEIVSISTEAEQQKPHTIPTWLPFGLSWKAAWRLSTIVMPLLFLLSLIGLGLGVYSGIASQGYPLPVNATWAMVNIVLLLVMVLHTVIDLLVVWRWENNNWNKAVNGYTGPLLGAEAICLFFGAVTLSLPASFGASSFCVLIGLGALTFIDIWVLNHMKEKGAQEEQIDGMIE
jgi:hypothetical protein